MSTRKSCSLKVFTLLHTVLLCLLCTVCIIIKHVCETHLSIPPHVLIEVRKASRISCSAAAASVLGSRASSSHPQIYNQAKDELPFSSALLTSAFHLDKLPHLLLRWRQTLSRRALSWQSDHHQGGRWCHGTPSALQCKRKNCWPHFWDHTLWKDFLDFLDCRGDDDQRKYVDWPLHNEMQMRTPEQF